MPTRGIARENPPSAGMDMDMAPDAHQRHDADDAAFVRHIKCALYKKTKLHC